MRPERDRSDSRSRLIQAAVETFCQEGYRVSVEAIAARAGVAKQTLYNHFACKDDLLGEVARCRSELMLDALDPAPGELRASLLRFAVAYRRHFLGDEGLALFRAVIGEAGRAPEFARSIVAKGPEKTSKGLAAFLDAAMTRGSLRRDDPQFAAEMLMGMLIALDRARRVAGHKPLSARAEALRCERIVDCFLRAYGPDRSAK